MDLSGTDFHEQYARTLVGLAAQRHPGSDDAAMQAVYGWVEQAARERGMRPTEGPRVPYRNEVRRRRRQANRRAAAQFRVIGERDGYLCRECGTGRELTVEHIIPVFLGGTDDLDNLEILCASCNTAKGIAEAEEAAAQPAGDVAPEEEPDECGVRFPGGVHDVPAVAAG